MHCNENPLIYQYLVYLPVISNQLITIKVNNLNWINSSLIGIVYDRFAHNVDLPYKSTRIVLVKKWYGEHELPCAAKERDTSEMNITGTLPQAGNLKLFVPSLSTQSSTRPKQNIFNVVLMRPDKTEWKTYFTTMQNSY